MEPSNHETDQRAKRTRLFGVIFAIIGICFLTHGGLNLLEIYSRKTPMFELEAAFTPEKGRMWSEFLAGMSICLMGILIGIKAARDLKQKNKSG